MQYAQLSIKIITAIADAFISSHKSLNYLNLLLTISFLLYC